ncbi:hypothetical protein TELCIR_25561, partial [Teladorsagia circumcincta]
LVSRQQIVDELHHMADVRFPADVCMPGSRLVHFDVVLLEKCPRKRRPYHRAHAQTIRRFTENKLRRKISSVLFLCSSGTVDLPGTWIFH